MKKLVCILGLFWILVITGCNQSIEVPLQDTEMPSQKTGIIQECEYTMGEERCGECFCLKDEEGCHIIDTTNLGDLSYALNEKVAYVGEKGIFGSKMCPNYIKISELEVIS